MACFFSAVAQVNYGESKIAPDHAKKNQSVSGILHQLNVMHLGGFASSAITANSATVGCTAVVGAVSYDVDYKTNASGACINAATASTAASVNLTGIAAST